MTLGGRLNALGVGFFDLLAAPCRVIIYASAPRKRAMYSAVNTASSSVRCPLRSCNTARLKLITSKLNVFMGVGTSIHSDHL